MMIIQRASIDIQAPAFQIRSLGAAVSIRQGLAADAGRRSATHRVFYFETKAGQAAIIIATIATHRQSRNTHRNWSGAAV
jgi:hypothetical protein